MKIKASLHIHTTEDAYDGYIIKYNVFELVDKAQELGLKVLALTCHGRYVLKKKHLDYAKVKGILLIGGVELELNKTLISQDDVVVLNCDKTIEQVKTFKQLANYKKEHPEIFVLAAHPAYGWRYAMGIKKLLKFIDLFDAIEHCWFYSKFFNLNKKVERIAKKFDKPFIASADAHIFKYLPTDYAIIETKELTTENVFDAIKQKKFINVTKEKKIFVLVLYLIMNNLKEFIFYPYKWWHNKKY